MSIKGVIFDLDGTLLYTLEDLYLATNFALKQCSLKERTIDEIQCFVGNGIEKLIEKSVNPHKEKFAQCLDEFKKYYNKHQKDNTKPYKNAVETLKKIQKNGIKIAVLSNKIDSAVKTLVEEYFPNLIDVIRGETDEFPKKPNPLNCLDIINKMGFKKEEILFIGDSEVDIQTAKNAGIVPISVSWGYKTKEFLKENNAVKIVDDFDELYEYIKALI